MERNPKGGTERKEGKEDEIEELEEEGMITKSERTGVE